MANEVLFKQSTIITLADSGGDVVLGLSSLANGAASQSAIVDFGTTFSKEWTMEVKMIVASAPSAQKAIDFYLSWSPDGTNFTGNCTGSSASYTYGLPSNGIHWLEYIGSAVSTNSTSAITSVVGTFTPRSRYCAVVAYNLLGVALGAVNGDSSYCKLVPIVEEIQ